MPRCGRNGTTGAETSTRGAAWASRRRNPPRAFGCRGPALAQEHPGQLVLLGHVVQLVPREIGAVVAGRGVVGEREEADLGPVHDFPTARGAIAPWWHAGRASGCRPGYTFDHAGDRRLRPV